MKRCWKCGITKEKAGFYKSKRDGLQPMCIVCCSDHIKIYSRANRDVYNQGMWKYRGIKNTDGSQFSSDDYNRLIEAQNHRCAICNATDEFHRLSVDHNHQTMIARLLICDYCNRNVIGKYEKSGWCRHQSEAEAYLLKTQGYLPTFPEPTADVLYMRTYYKDETNDHRRRERNWKQQNITFNGQPLIWEIAELIIKEKNNACAVCGKPSTLENLSADHDKLTGEVRGALCAECNRRAIPMVEKYGFYRSDEATRKIKDYLMDPPANRLKTGLENDPEFATPI